MFEALRIRVKSTGPARRAGLILTPIGHWTEHTLEDGDQLATAQTLKALIADPALTVELGEPKPDGSGVIWHPAMPLETVDEIIAALSVLDQAAQAPDPEDTHTETEEPAPQDAGQAPSEAGSEDTQPEPSLPAESASEEPSALTETPEADSAPAPKPAKAPKR